MPGENTSSGTGAERVGIDALGRDLPLVDREPVDVERHRALDREVHDRQRARREPPRRREPDRAVALHLEGRRARESRPRGTRVTRVDAVVVGLLGHDSMSVSVARARAQQRIGCRRRKPGGLELGGVDGDAGHGERIGGAALGQHAEVALDERGRAVELAVDRAARRRRRRASSSTPTIASRVRSSASRRRRRADAAGAVVRARRARSVARGGSAAACPSPPGPRAPV